MIWLLIRQLVMPRYMYDGLCTLISDYCRLVWEHELHWKTGFHKLDSYDFCERGHHPYKLPSVSTSTV